MMYYVYVYKDPETYEIKYVGKGIRNRDISHWLRRETHCNFLFRQYLMTLFHNGVEPIIERIKENLSSYDAFLLEHELIKRYGRLGFDRDGILFNRSLGFEFIPFEVTSENHEALRLYLTSSHFNFVNLTEEEEAEICEMYVQQKLGIIEICKRFKHGPDKIKQVLTKHEIPFKSRGGQSGENNGMHGKLRENNAHFKGHHHSAASKMKISNSSKKPVTIDGVQYNSSKEAANALRLPYSTYTYYLRIGKLKRTV